MSWLRSQSLSFARQLSRSLDARHDYEPQACYSSFCKHWQQAHEIIAKSQPANLHDSVLAVVNHVEQMSSLLSLEARAGALGTPGGAGGGGAGPAGGPGGGGAGPPGGPGGGGADGAECLEYLLSENLLDHLYEWAAVTGKYENAVRLELLKLYGILIGHYSSQVIGAEPFLRPLLKLLSGFRNQLTPPNVEGQLVSVLNQLCVVLMSHPEFIDLFFMTSHTEKGSYSECLLIRLLLPCVHRAGPAGAAARDALLLCGAASVGCAALRRELRAGDTCVVLATGLSGLYSLLPRTLRAPRLTPDDVRGPLALFADSLEFCTAMAQVSHPDVGRQLLDLLYHGFLVPVLGPALLQPKPPQSGGAEQAAATAHLELVLRCAAPRRALRPVAAFVARHEYDGARLLDALLRRLDGDSQLSLVTLSLMETLIDLNCEDVTLELVLKYLIRGEHLPPGQAELTSRPELYREAAAALLALAPRCCARPLAATRRFARDMGRTELGRRKENDIAMDELARDAGNVGGGANESMIGSYHAYLTDARYEVVSRSVACAKWSSKYERPLTRRQIRELTEREKRHTPAREQDSLIGDSKNSDTEHEPLSLTSLVEELNGTGQSEKENTTDLNPDSLTSVGESGYESLRWRCEDGDEECAEESFLKSLTRESARVDGPPPAPAAKARKARPEAVIGPLLTCLLKKAAALLESDLATNLRVTGLISKLCALPAPLVASLLLCPGLQLQPHVPSLYQILAKLKREVDVLTDNTDGWAELVDAARVFLVRREMALLRPRAAADAHPPTPESRDEPKRRSLSQSFSSMFSRRLSSSSPSRGGAPAPPPRPAHFLDEAYWSQSITLRSVLNAQLLAEWLRELAALAEEQALRCAGAGADAL